MAMLSSTALMILFSHMKGIALYKPNICQLLHHISSLKTTTTKKIQNMCVSPFVFITSCPPHYKHCYTYHASLVVGIITAAHLLAEIAHITAKWQVFPTFTLTQGNTVLELGLDSFLLLPGWSQASMKYSAFPSLYCIRARNLRESRLGREWRQHQNRREV